MGLWDFLKRHRRKFYVTGALVGGVYAAGKFVQWKLSEYTDRVMADEVSQARKKHHYDSNQRTCKMTAVTLLPSIRESLFQMLDTESLTTKLKSSPQNKVSTWQDLKSVSFARLVSSVYACCLLVTFLRVQLNILGGCMYNGEMQDGASSGFQISTEVHKEYLAAVQYFLGPGLTRLVELVQQAVNDILGSVSLKEKIGAADLERLIAEVRRCVEVEAAAPTVGPTASARSRQPREHLLAVLLLPPEDEASAVSLAAASEAGDGVSASPATQGYIKQLMGYTRDIVESDDFRTTLDSSLDGGFRYCLADLNSSLASPEAAGSSGSLPLAKLIPMLNARSHSLFAGQCDGIVSSLMSEELLNQFSANVYEAFSTGTPLE